MDSLHEGLHAFRVHVESNQQSKCRSKNCLGKKHTEKNKTHFMSDKYFSKSFIGMTKQKRLDQV
jgi:hypothetical protein